MKSGVTLQQMLTEVKRQSESKEDYLIAPNRLRMESYGKEMFLHLSDDSGTELIEPMTITGIEAAARQIRFDTGCNLFANSSDTIIVNVEPKRHPAGVLAWYPPVRIRMKRKTSRKRKVLLHPSKNAPTGSRRRNVTIPIRRRIKPYCSQAIWSGSI